MHTIAASSLMLAAGCITQPIDDIVEVEELKNDETVGSRNFTHRLTYGSTVRDVSSLTPVVMTAVSAACNSKTLLTEQDVEMTLVATEHTRIIDPAAEVVANIYNFRCPEPGKEIQ